MSSLFGTHKRPLIVEIAPDNRRMVAEIFPAADGIVYFDYGWHVNVGVHPIHAVTGKITGKGPWRVGETVIRELELDDPQRYWLDWRDWQAICVKNYPPRDRIEAIARRFGALV